MIMSSPAETSSDRINISDRIIADIQSLQQTPPSASSIFGLSSSPPPVVTLRSKAGLARNLEPDSYEQQLAPDKLINYWRTSVTAVKNGRRKMEDRHVVIHDLNSECNLEVRPMIKLPFDCSLYEPAIFSVNKCGS